MALRVSCPLEVVEAVVEGGVSRLRRASAQECSEVTLNIDWHHAPHFARFTPHGPPRAAPEHDLRRPRPSRRSADGSAPRARPATGRPSAAMHPLPLSTDTRSSPPSATPSPEPLDPAYPRHHVNCTEVHHTTRLTRNLTRYLNVYVPTGKANLTGKTVLSRRQSRSTPELRPRRLIPIQGWHTAQHRRLPRPHWGRRRGSGTTVREYILRDILVEFPMEGTSMSPVATLRTLSGI